MTQPTHTFLAYAVSAPTLDQARLLVEQALQVVLQEHDSSYKGGRYFRWGLPGSSDVVLQRAYDADPAQLFEAGCRPDEWLLYVSKPRRPDESHAALLASGQARLLWRREH